MHDHETDKMSSTLLDRVSSSRAWVEIPDSFFVLASAGKSFRRFCKLTILAIFMSLSLSHLEAHFQKAGFLGI